MSRELIDAIDEQDPEKAARIIAEGSDPNALFQGMLPLVEASTRSTLAVANVLLAAGADVNRIDEQGHDSPLTAACDAANLEIVETLVTHGADVNYCREGVSTPLSIASQGKESQRPRIVECLLRNGADASAVFHSQFGVAVSNVLMDASGSGSVECVRLLIQAGAPVNQRLFFGTPLICAAEAGRHEIVRLLLENHADPVLAALENPRLGDIAGMTPLEIARMRRHRKVIALLIRSK